MKPGLEEIRAQGRSALHWIAFIALFLIFAAMVAKVLFPALPLSWVWLLGALVVTTIFLVVIVLRRRDEGDPEVMS